MKLNGLIAATYTPLTESGELALPAIDQLVEFCLRDGVTGLYVCGSTGEGMSLTTDERKAVAERFVTATAGRVPVLIQVGHNCVADACELARHAAEIGASAVSATCPSYFKITQVDQLVACMAEIAAAAGDVPFYYYHIPVLTGSQIDMPEFLQRASQRISNLAGLKYTNSTLHEFQLCRELNQGQFDVVWGCDEMLLGALATGAEAAIGSTYNIAAPVYQRIIDAWNRGDAQEARRWQAKSIQLVRCMFQFPFHAAMKATLTELGVPLGPCRLPQENLTEQQRAELREQLQAIDFFDWRTGEG